VGIAVEDDRRNVEYVGFLLTIRRMSIAKELEVLVEEMSVALWKSANAARARLPPALTVHNCHQYVFAVGVATVSTDHLFGCPAHIGAFPGALTRYARRMMGVVN
jgi:hypothetical protein